MIFVRTIAGVSKCQNCECTADWLEYLTTNSQRPDRELYRLCEECILLLDLQEKLAE